MIPKYIIWCQTPDGMIFEAFRWCRDAPSGVKRAIQEAAAFNVKVVKVWAEPIH